MSTLDNTVVCEQCSGRGTVDVRYGDRHDMDGERGCDACCEHKTLILISGPGFACDWCCSWFPDRAAAEREVASR